MKKLITTCLTMLTLAVLPNIASALTNGGFETGDLTGWTAEYADSGHNGATGNALSVTEDYHYSGGHALWGSASLVGNLSGWGGLEDWTRTYAWSDSQNLSSATSIQLHLTDFQSNQYPVSWGYGQEVFLVLDDGTNRASALLIDNHEAGYTSLVDRGLCTTSTGGDGRDWYGFDVPMDADANSFGDSFLSLDLSSAKVGIYWESISWCTVSVQTLWASAAVDDIQPIPEPATICLLGLGALSLLRRKR